VTARRAREQLVHELRHPLSVIARASGSQKALAAALDAIRAAALEQAAMLDRLERPERSAQRKR
jgi:hypothetical protein